MHLLNLPLEMIIPASSHITSELSFKIQMVSAMKMTYSPINSVYTTSNRSAQISLSSQRPIFIGLTTMYNLQVIAIDDISLTILNRLPPTALIHTIPPTNQEGHARSSSTTWLAAITHRSMTLLLADGLLPISACEIINSCLSSAVIKYANKALLQPVRKQPSLNNGLFSNNKDKTTRIPVNNFTLISTNYYPSSSVNKT